MSKTKKSVTWIVIIAAIMIGGYYYFSSQRPKTEYVTEEIKKGDIAQTVSVTGEITADNKIDLAFKLSGRVRSLNAVVGDQVKTGQLLGSLEPGALNAQLQQAREQVEFQKKTLANMKERDETYNSEQKDAQRAQVRSAEEGVRALLAQFGDSRLFSPLDGIVLKRNTEPGEIVTAATAVLRVGNPENLIIESDVPESDIVKIALGQKAAVTLHALSEEEIFTAEIFAIEPAATIVQDVVFYRIKLKLANQDARLKDGMSADIDIKTAEKQNVLAVPARAIKTDEGKKYVEIMKNEATTEIEKHTIITGLEGDEGLIEVVSGVNAGEKVITLVKTP